MSGEAPPSQGYGAPPPISRASKPSVHIVDGPHEEAKPAPKGTSLNTCSNSDLSFGDVEGGAGEGAGGGAGGVTDALTTTTSNLKNATEVLRTSYARSASNAEQKESFGSKFDRLKVI